MESQGVFPLSVLNCGQTPGMALFPGLPRGASDAKTGTDGETFAGQPSLEDATHDIESARLDDSPPDLFGAADSNIDDALEGETETVSGMFIKEGWVKGRLWLGSSGAGG